jgi:predicted CoA-binding protein
MSSNYNSRPRAAEVMVDGGRFQVVRRRETVAELYIAAMVVNPQFHGPVPGFERRQGTMNPRFTNPSMDEIRTLLRRIKTIAVVGLSASPRRPSHGVAKALQGFGYRIIPVNPALSEGWARRPIPVCAICPSRWIWWTCSAIEPRRRHRRRVHRLKLPALWLQDGVVDSAAALRARAAGIDRGDGPLYLSRLPPA